MQSNTIISWQGKALEMQAREPIIRKVAFAAVLMIMAGSVTSPALLSIGIVLVMLCGLVLMPFKEQIRRFWANKPAVLMSTLFFMQLISGIWTREMNLDAWLEEIKIKAPLFLGMYGFAVVGPFSIKQVRIALGLLIIATTLVATVTVVDYLIDPFEIEERIQVSKEMKVWLDTNNHIYFSIVAAFSILGAIWSIMQKGVFLFKYEKWVIGLLAWICFVDMHIMTTRTGLAGLYITIFLMGLFYLIQHRKFLIAISLTLFLISMPVIGYYSVKSFQYRIDNTLFDVKEYFEGSDPNYLSIGTRIESWKTAIHLWQLHPIIGVGMADLHSDMTDQYVRDQTRLCPENFVQPHNQFFQNLAGWGVIGFILLVIAWFYPVFAKSWPKGYLFWAFWLTFSLAMMGESTMERQVGVCFMVTVYMLSLGIGHLEKTKGQ